MPPPLLPNNDVSGEWECSLCTENYTFAPPLPTEDFSNRPWQTAEKDLVCKTCIIKLFEDAVKFDYYYPARYANRPLVVRDFAQILPRDLRHRYRAKVRDRRSRTLDLTVTVEGQERGKDYQLCPACGTVLCLEDGCNHVVCTCCAELCFVCGQHADDLSDHWMTDGCPRWSNNDTGEVYYDDEETDDEDDSEYDESDDDNDDDSVYHEIPKYLQLTEMEREARSAAATVHFHFTSWAFNVAMHSSEIGTRDALTRARHHLQGEEANHVDERHARAAMEAYNDLHGVSQEYWALLRWRWRVSQPLEPDQYTDDPFVDGFNSVFVDVVDWPESGVSGVFNMVLSRTRKAAWDWIEERVRSSNNGNANEHDNSDEHNNTAVFDMGPGGDLAMRKDAALLITWLRARMPRNTSVLFLENHAIIFQSMAGNALLVRVQSRDFPLSYSAQQAPTPFEETMRLILDVEEGDPFIPTMESLRAMFDDPEVLRWHGTERWSNTVSAVDSVQFTHLTKWWQLPFPIESDWDAIADEVGGNEAHDEAWPQWWIAR